MSYVALATDSFDEVASFYGELLGFPVVAEWDRPNGRGRRYDLGGLRLEILDNIRERQRLELFTPDQRTHIVIEVENIDVVRRRLALRTPEPRTVSWGARLFQIQDPDGVPVTFLQWTSLH
jgi:catechol 2,3-dioxygenase-like lactoylglutathione lyase family enzyme